LIFPPNELLKPQLM